MSVQRVFHLRKAYCQIQRQTLARPPACSTTANSTPEPNLDDVVITSTSALQPASFPDSKSYLEDQDYIYLRSTQRAVREYIEQVKASQAIIADIPVEVRLIDAIPPYTRGTIKQHATWHAEKVDKVIAAGHNIIAHLKDMENEPYKTADQYLTPVYNAEFDEMTRKELLDEQTNLAAKLASKAAHLNARKSLLIDSMKQLLGKNERRSDTAETAPNPFSGYDIATSRVVVEEHFPPSRHALPTDKTAASESQGTPPCPHLPDRVHS